MEERKEPKFVTFAFGDYVEGLLLGIESIETGEGKEKKRVPRYVVEQPNGELVSFLGTYQLNQKIRPGDKGRFIIVKCTGEDKTVATQGNAMKTFVVMMSKAKVAGADELVITDNDIPF